MGELIWKEEEDGGWDIVQALFDYFFT